MSHETDVRTSDPELDTNIEIAAKEDAVVRAGLAFSLSMRDASAAGRGTLRRAVKVVRPVLIGAGLLAVAGLGIGLLRRSRRRHALVLPRTNSNGPWPDIARAAAVALAAAAGRRLVEHWLRDVDGEAQRELPKLPPEPFR